MAETADPAPTTPASEPIAGERCRCCMAPGPAAKDLSSQYDFMGEKEVYADMLLESFDIRLQKIQSAGWTICEVCIGRLRDSSNFKKQVLYSERCLLQSVGQLTSSADQKPSGDSKMKMVKCESMSDDNDASFLDDDFFDLETDVKEVAVKFEPQPSTSELSNDEDIPLSKMTTTKKKIPTRSSMPMLTISPLKRSTLQKTPAKKTITLKSGVKITSTSGKLTPGKLNLQSASKIKNMGAVSKMLASASKLGQSPGTKMVLKPGQTKLTLGSTTLKRATVPKTTKLVVKPGAKLAATADKGRTDADPHNVHFSKAVLEHSTATPFDVRRRNVACVFRCQALLYRTPDSSESSLVKLRDHFKSHEKFITKVANGTAQFAIRVDITDLRCKVCNEGLFNLDDFEKHLRSAHNMNTYKDDRDTLVPYKLDTNQCQVCGVQFIDFESLDNHMESHFTVDICDVCGRGFMDTKKLTSHRKTEHTQEKLPCQECGLQFPNVSRLNAHVNKKHKGIAPLKCHKCDQRFISYNAKMKHMKERHGAKVEKHCKVCGKVYLSIGALNTHILIVHTDRIHKCQHCDKHFPTQSMMIRHEAMMHPNAMVTCVHCHKQYTNVKSLKKHMETHHADREKRCLCYYCGIPCRNRTEMYEHMKIEHHAPRATAMLRTCP